jgi:Uma2 family endonuclease
MTITLAKWTLQNYHQMIAAGILDDRCVELLNGEIVEMVPEGVPHASSSDETAEYLRKLLGSRARVRESHPITLPNASEPEPDIAIVEPLPEIYRQHHPYPENIFWLIEFSNSSLDKDLGLKKQVYAEAGIQEYWVVNLKVRHLKVFRDQSPHGYQTELTLTEGAIAPIAFPDIQIDVKRMFSI